MQTVMAFVGGLGGWEIVLIILVIVMFFGAKKIPELARGLGKGLREFKDATNEIKNDIEMNDNNKKRNNAPVSNKTTNETHTNNDVRIKDDEVVTGDIT